MSRPGLAALAGLLWATAALAQEPPRPRPDTTRAGPPAVVRDTTLRTAADSARADSLRIAAEEDSTYNARYLELQGRAKLVRPVMPVVGRLDVAAPLSRVVFTRDSLDWAAAETLADLLVRVPGTYVWRGGWIGRQELPVRQGRGPSSVEYLVDGVPLVPLGPDSVAVDPSLLALSLYDRVEVETWPGLLRVRLQTRQHGRLAARSRIGLWSGSGSFARYVAGIETRNSRGVGIAAQFDYLSADEALPSTNTARNSALWVQLNWVPDARRGVQLQLQRASPRRSRYLPPGGGAALDDSLRGTRQDLQLRAFRRQRDDGFGLGFDVQLTRSSWGDSLLAQGLWLATATLGHRTPTRSALLSAGWRSRWTTADVRGQLGWAPSRALSMHLDAGWLRHTEGRSSTWGAARASLALPAGLVLSGAARGGTQVAVPAFAGDTAQRLADLEGSVAFERPWLTLRATAVRTSAFARPAFWQFPSVPQGGTLAATTWLIGALRLRPLPWLTLDGWVSDPRGRIVGQPPRHAVGWATVRTTFPRVFRSGVLEVQLRGGAERWEEGVLGFLADGTPVPLPAATFFRGSFELRFGELYAFIERGNLRASARGYVPGYQIGTRPTVVGLRWSFTN